MDQVTYPAEETVDTAGKAIRTIQALGLLFSIGIRADASEEEIASRMEQAVKTARKYLASKGLEIVQVAKGDA